MKVSRLLNNKGRKRGVAPVLSTLMLVAVAVALCTIFFSWSQSFLSQTAEASSSQMAALNIAARSGILIDHVVFNTAQHQATIYVRNVGSASVTPDTYSYSVYGYSSNSGSTGISPLNPGQSASFTVTDSQIASGRVFSIRVTTTAGTFAQGAYLIG